MDEIQQRLAQIEEPSKAYGRNKAVSSSFGVAPKATDDNIPLESDNGASNAGPQESTASHYNTGFLSSLTKAGLSKDDKVINLLLNKHGDSSTVIGSMEGLERYFPSRLDTVAQLIAKQLGLQMSSWSSLKATVLDALEAEHPKFSSGASLGYVLKHISETLPPSPAKVHRKARHKK